MGRRLLIGAWIVVLGGGCSETVGFLSVELLAPSYRPGILCPEDPRRTQRVTVRAICDGESTERTVDITEEACTLNEVPLGECSVEVSGENAHGRRVLGGQTIVTIAVPTRPRS